MRSSTLASRLQALICPLCETSKLYPSDRDSVRCELCSGYLSGTMLETLGRISALPDALGKHACECGHPEMRLLPDRTFHCPACGSEVLPLGTSPVTRGSDERTEAYRAGWLDGHFREMSSFVDNPDLARWEDLLDRLDYYGGDRAGRGSSSACSQHGSRTSEGKGGEAMRSW